MRTRSLLSLGLLPFFAACSTSDDMAATPESAAGAAAATSSDAGDARQAIDAAMARYIDAVERGDTAAIAASFTDEPIIVMPSGPAMKGRSEVAQGFTEMLAASSVKDLRSANVDRIVSGDIAVETGTFEVTMQPKAGGAEVTDKGQYLVVWQRQRDGSWKMARGFNRSDMPPKS